MIDICKDFDKEITKFEKGLGRISSKISKDLKIPKGVRYSSREPVPRKIKQKVRDRAKNRCEVCNKKPADVTLEFHHKNMKPNDNSFKNIQLLCPTHHRQKHGRAYRKRFRDVFGRVYTTRLVDKKKTKSRKAARHKRRKKTRTSLERVAEKAQKML